LAVLGRRRSALRANFVTRIGDVAQLAGSVAIRLVRNGYEWSKERDQSWSSTFRINNLQRQLLRAKLTTQSTRDGLGARRRPRKRVGVLRDSEHRTICRSALFGDSSSSGCPEMINRAGLVEQGRLDAQSRMRPLPTYTARIFRTQSRRKPDGPRLLTVALVLSWRRSPPATAQRGILLA